MRVSITWHNPNPNTIWNKLATQLGREPADAEARAEIHRIMSSALVDSASRGKLKFQR